MKIEQLRTNDDLRQKILEVETFIENHKNRSMHLLDLSILIRIMNFKYMDKAKRNARKRMRKEKNND